MNEQSDAALVGSGGKPSDDRLHLHSPSLGAGWWGGAITASVIIKLIHIILPPDRSTLCLGIKNIVILSV